VLRLETVATYRSKSFFLSDASVGWRDENATTDPLASIDGPPLGSIHSSPGSPLTRPMMPVMLS
jgi:hypothetical protein